MRILKMFDDDVLQVKLGGLQTVVTTSRGRQRKALHLSQTLS